MIKRVLLAASIALTATSAYADAGLEAAKKIVAEMNNTGEVSGYKVEVKEVETDGYQEEALLFDGKEVLRGYRIALIGKHAIGTDTGLFGKVLHDGNSCESSPFLVYVDKHKKVTPYGPIETCLDTVFQIDENTVTFETQDIPGLGQEKWQWTTEKGIVPLGKTDFVSRDQSHWGAVRGKTIDNPWDAINNITINDAIKSILGENYKEYTEILSSVGSGKHKGHNYIGISCTAHMCNEEGALLILDGKNEKVFAAYKTRDQKIQVFPNAKSWPKNFRQELASWSKKFK
ncbi:hypothetical protein [Brucella thiophenivorans]|uniref:DUF4424 domain-containing protein n=1 Tax=Brucella thiophenivorans TaxID=571255 RepID=A0A256FU50_9HYPH|nr:hypothetical protein [Brucella thiophenivorans]OYR18280.1 hypothetical protein CEV31_4292 [Brucella thiophenivorans]